MNSSNNFNEESELSIIEGNNNKKVNFLFADVLQNKEEVCVKDPPNTSFLKDLIRHERELSYETNSYDLYTENENSIVCGKMDMRKAAGKEMSYLCQDLTNLPTTKDCELSVALPQDQAYLIIDCAPPSTHLLKMFPQEEQSKFYSRFENKTEKSASRLTNKPSPPQPSIHIDQNTQTNLSSLKKLTKIKSTLAIQKSIGKIKTENLIKKFKSKSPFLKDKQLKNNFKFQNNKQTIVIKISPSLRLQEFASTQKNILMSIKRKKNCSIIPVQSKISHCSPNFKSQFFQEENSGNVYLSPKHHKVNNIKNKASPKNVKVHKKNFKSQ